ncbi:hypothetical protein QJQ45_018654, partial [Haematococcus lacustris]
MLPPFCSDPTVCQAREAARDAQYLGLALPRENIIWVGDEAGCRHAQALLSGAAVLGLDVEWRPTGGCGRACLLQVATDQHVLLFDLLLLLDPPSPSPSPSLSALPPTPTELAAARHTHGGLAPGQDVCCGEGDRLGQAVTLGGRGSAAACTGSAGGDGGEVRRAMDACLSSVLHDPRCLKLGLEVVGDLRKLASSWPSMQAFQQVVNVLEVRELWAEHLRRTNPGAAKLQRVAGLSTLCAALLGKPLDKAMQVSDWEQRPLSAKQIKYAAQDAHVLTRLHRELCALLPCAGEVQACKAFTFSG